jgi:hypothetical protein
MAALRIFFSFYFFLTALRWCFDAFHLGYFLRFLSSDLTGKRIGLDSSYLWLRLDLESHGLKYIVFTLMFSGCLGLLFNKWPKITASIVLVCAQLISYSISGRSIEYDMISYAFIGYWIATLVNPTKWMIWACTTNALACVYSLSAITKLSKRGLGWISETRTGFFLHHGQARYETGATFFQPLPWLVDFFSTPNIYSVIALTAVLVIEFCAIFILLFRQYSWLYLLSLIALHFGMLFIISVFWPPPVVLLAILAVISFANKDWWRGPLGKLNNYTLPLSLVVALVLFSLYIPSGPRRNVTLVAPFSRFDMYSGPENNQNFFFFKNSSGKIIERKELTSAVKMSTQNINAMLAEKFKRSDKIEFISAFLCEWFNNHQPLSAPLYKAGLHVWVRNINLNINSNRIESHDLWQKECK